MKNKLLNLTIALLGILLAVLMVFTISELYDTGRVYRYKAEDLLRFVRGQDYGNMLHCVYMNEAGGVYASEDMKECYAVAHYYEAATFYKAYAQCGKSEEAAKQKKVMEEQKALMGTLAYTAEEIDRKLGLKN